MSNKSYLLFYFNFINNEVELRILKPEREWDWNWNWWSPTYSETKCSGEFHVNPYGFDNGHTGENGKVDLTTIFVEAIEILSDYGRINKTSQKISVV